MSPCVPSRKRRRARRTRWGSGGRLRSAGARGGRRRHRTRPAAGSAARSGRPRCAARSAARTRRLGREGRARRSAAGQSLTSCSRGGWRASSSRISPCASASSSRSCAFSARRRLFSSSVPRSRARIDSSLARSGAAAAATGCGVARRGAARSRRAAAGGRRGSGRLTPASVATAWKRDRLPAPVELSERVLGRAARRRASGRRPRRAARAMRASRSRLLVLALGVAPAASSITSMPADADCSAVVGVERVEAVEDPAQRPLVLLQQLHEPHVLVLLVRVRAASGCG